MSVFVQVFRAKVAPSDVARLLEIRPAAIAQAQAKCPVPLRAELVKLDDGTWLDILTWSEPNGAEQLMEHAAELPLLGEMHSLIGQVMSVRAGEVAHSTHGLTPAR
ncbi:hypothetical protein [Polymorphospora rubra]|uniref:hypothetical protein n=1 Tax=Polymorphospora rubra TaxID=338584 RepID=UPI0033E47DA1